MQTNAVKQEPQRRGPWKDAPNPRKAENDTVLSYLRSLNRTLFGVFDAACSDQILAHFQQFGTPADFRTTRPTGARKDDPSRCEFECFYLGKLKESTGSSGPWIARIPKDSPLLDELVEQGWPNFWGYFVTSNHTLFEEWSHFRHFTLARLPNQEITYFRFADPRILNAFLECASAEQKQGFLGVERRLIWSVPNSQGQCPILSCASEDNPQLDGGTRRLVFSENQLDCFARTSENMLRHRIARGICTRASAQLKYEQVYSFAGLCMLEGRAAGVKTNAAMMRFVNLSHACRQPISNLPSVRNYLADGSQKDVDTKLAVMSQSFVEFQSKRARQKA